MSETTSETKVLIYGSCVSRDTFEFLPEPYRLITYVARQSAVSAFAAADGVLQRLHDLPSAFQNRMIKGDVRADLLPTLERHASNADLLLLDLIDERGGVIEIGGGYVTKLSEFWTAGGREVTKGSRHLEFGTDEHFVAWRAAFALLARELHRLRLAERTLVLRTPWASRTPDGSDIPIPGWMLDPRRANELYERYFASVAEAGLTVLTLPDELARSPLDHRWGPSPFHYTETAYRWLAEGIERFVADRASALHTVPRRDTSAWGRGRVFADVAALAADCPDSGLVTIATAETPIDLLLENNHAGTTVVSLHAALGSKPMDLPIFTARSVTEGIGVNRIFVSDPGLYADPELKLAWYLGTAELDLTAVLHDVIEAIQNHFGAEHLVFFGPSGGGFAALNLAQTFPDSLAVPVNPQTRIADYHLPAVESFVSACFGAAEGSEAAIRVLERHPRADLRRVYARGFENHVIYLQNSQDPHVRRHLLPWLEAVADRRRIHVLLRAWGRGHVPPDAPQLRALLAHVPAVAGDWTRLANEWGALTAPEPDRLTEGATAVG